MIRTKRYDSAKYQLWHPYNIFQGSISNNTTKAREIEELARLCDKRPCCCDMTCPCPEARELAKAKKNEGPRQIPSKLSNQSLFIEIY